jgi:hypothetical protein
LFDYDDWLVLDDSGFNYLLLRGFQIALAFSFLAHALHGIHHIALLRQERIAHIGSPANVVGEALYHIGQSGQCLNTWIPWLFCHSIGERLVFEPWVLRQPLLELNDFEWIRGSGQHLR